jgi:hypothetical protein
VDDWPLNQLLTYDASSEDLEDANDEINGPPVSGLDLVRPKQIRRAAGGRARGRRSPIAAPETVRSF